MVFMVLLAMAFSAFFMGRLARLQTPAGLPQRGAHGHLSAGAVGIVGLAVYGVHCWH